MRTQTEGYVDKDEALSVLRDSVDDLSRILRSVRNPEVRTVGTWSIRDLGVHLADVFDVHGAAVQGKPAPVERIDQIAEVNQKLIDANTERDLSVLADRVEQTGAAYMQMLSSIEGDPVVPWGEFEVPLSAVISADIGECLVHGYDITTAEGRSWAIDPYRAALASKGVSPMAIHYVDGEAARGFEARYNLRLRGQWQLDFVFNDGALSIEEPSGRADVHISAEPVAFMLVGYGRVNMWGPVLKGKIVPWGRKPWLALKFGSLLKNP